MPYYQIGINFTRSVIYALQQSAQTCLSLVKRGMENSVVSANNRSLGRFSKIRNWEFSALCVTSELTPTCHESSLFQVRLDFGK